MVYYNLVVSVIAIVYALDAPNHATDRKNHDEVERPSQAPAEPHEWIDQMWKVGSVSGLILNFILKRTLLKEIKQQSI